MKINTFEINFNMTLKNLFLIQWKLRHYEIKWNYETNHFKFLIDLWNEDHVKLHIILIKCVIYFLMKLK